MPLSYYPRPGEVLLCRYDANAIAPEMVKPRPVVVVGPRLRRRANLVTIAPFSTSEPEPPEAYHALIELVRPLPAPFGSPRMWAKCDMIQSVALARLDRFKIKRPQAKLGNGQPGKSRMISLRRSAMLSCAA